MVPRGVRFISESRTNTLKSTPETRRTRITTSSAISSPLLPATRYPSTAAITINHTPAHNTRKQDAVAKPQCHREESHPSQRRRRKRRGTTFGYENATGNIRYGHRHQAATSLERQAHRRGKRHWVEATLARRQVAITATYRQLHRLHTGCMKKVVHQVQLEGRRHGGTHCRRSTNGRRRSPERRSPRLHSRRSMSSIIRGSG